MDLNKEDPRGTLSIQDHPRPEYVDELDLMISRVRHGQDITSTDLSHRLAAWLAAHDAEVWDQGANAVIEFEWTPGHPGITNPYRK